LRSNYAYRIIDAGGKADIHPRTGRILATLVLFMGTLYHALPRLCLRGKLEGKQTKAE